MFISDEVETLLSLHQEIIKNRAQFPENGENFEKTSLNSNLVYCGSILNVFLTEEKWSKPPYFTQQWGISESFAYQS